MKHKIKEILLRVPGGSILLKIYRKCDYYKRSYHFYKGTGGIRNPKDIFTQYYNNYTWDDKESRSGPGSTIKYTSNIRKEIPNVIEKLEVRRLLDAPCGDYNWFSHIQRDKNVFYIGGDIVEPLIANNQNRYGNENTTFMCAATENDGQMI
jgi:hypothetical protein